MFCFLSKPFLPPLLLFPGESRSTASPSSSGDQKGCGLATMNHSNSNNGRNNTHSPSSTLPPPHSSSSPAANSANGGPLVNALNGHPNMGLSFLTSQMAMSANKLFKLAQQHQQQQNYRPSPPASNHNGHQSGVKRKHLDSAVALLTDRLSPGSAGSANNNNSFSVNNLNLEKLAHRINGNGQQPNMDDTSASNYAPKNLTAKDLNSSSRASPPSTIKSERISPINFNQSNGKAGKRSRSSTPSSSVVFNPSSNNGGSNGTLGLNGNGTGQQQHHHLSRNGSSSELSLSRPSHHQLSNHHHQTFAQQQQHQSLESRIHGPGTPENLQQSMARQGEPGQVNQARNYSDMIRSLAAKYNTSNE